MTAIPARYPATGADTAISITRAVTHHRLGLRLTFDRRLDPSLLGRAVRLTLEAEPILGCAFRTDERHAYWERLDDLDSAHGFSVRETTDADSDVRALQAAEVDDAGPLVRVVLLRGPVFDDVAIAISHVVADGQAAKQYAYLLAETYCRLANDTAYEPDPNLTPRPTGRDVWANLTREQRAAAKRAKSWANPTWRVPSHGSSGEGLTYSTRSLEPAIFRALKEYGKQRGATVNDMLLTAVLRTCIREFDPESGVPLSLMCTADLRRFLAHRNSLPICNISISSSLDIERVDNESFDQTLTRVHERMGVWARQCYGAAPLMNAEKMTALGYKLTQRLLRATFKLVGGSGKTYPWFTNIGVIDDSRLSFGASLPVGAFVYGPATSGGSVVPVVSTYRGTLTLCMGFCRQDCEDALIERVLVGISGELQAVVGQ